MTSAEAIIVSEDVKPPDAVHLTGSSAWRGGLDPPGRPFEGGETAEGAGLADSLIERHIGPGSAGC